MTGEQIIAELKPKSLNTHTCTRTFMSTKTITIMEDAYTLLLENKGAQESFSQEIRRIVGRTEFIPATRIFKKILSDSEAMMIKKDMSILRDANIQALKKVNK